MDMYSYRRRSRLSFPKLMAILIGSAVALLILAIIVAYICGVRYMTAETGDGLKVRFFGIVDSDGDPKSGVIKYSDGRSAKVKDDGSLEYSSGDV